MLFTKITQHSMKTKKQEVFDYQNFEKEALAALYAGEPLEESMDPLLKRIVEAGLQSEMQAHFEEEKASEAKNRRNGRTSKTIRSRFRQLSIETPRDREGTYGPTLLPQRDWQLGNGVEQKILNLYGMGISYRQIQSHLQDLYSVELSEA